MHYLLILTNTKQYTELSHTKNGNNCNYISSISSVKYGVPQGSILGPLLFNLFVNDLPSYINRHCIMYADDVSINLIAESEPQLEAEIKNIIGKLSEWYTANKLIININKTNIIFFHESKRLDKITYKHFNINFVESSKLLGVYIDSNLKWKFHCENLIYKLNKALYAM